MVERSLGSYHLLARRRQAIEMGPRNIVNATRDRAHDAATRAPVLWFQVVRDRPDSEECHLRLKRAPEGSEVIQDRARGRVADRVRLENVFAVGTAQRLYGQPP